MRVGTVVFPRVNAGDPGIETRSRFSPRSSAPTPATGRRPPTGQRRGFRDEIRRRLALVYRLSQQHRRALPEENYRSFFEKGEISAELEATLIARYKEKQAAGQWVPPLGEL